MSDAATNPPQQPSPEASGTSDFGAPVEVGPVAELATPPASSAPSAPPVAGDPEGTARLFAALVDGLFRNMGDPPPVTVVPWAMTDAEREELARDLVPVLKKHGVEDLPYQEEVQAIATTVRVSAPRLRRWWREKKERQQGDRPQSRQTGERQNSAPSQVGDSPLTGSATPSRILA